MIKEIKIKIGNNEFLVKRTYRSLMLFEETCGISITQLRYVKDYIMLFYCVIKLNNTINFTYEQFIDMLEQDQDALNKFNQYLIDLDEKIPEDSVKKKRTNHSKS